MAIQNFSPLQLNSTLTVGVDDTGHDVKFFGATSGRSMLWDESYDGLILSDNTKLQLGSSTGSGDLQLLHDGTNSYVKNHIGDLYIQQNTNDKDLIFQCDDQSGGVHTYFFLDGSTGFTQFPDSKQLTFGAGNDLKIQHNGTNSEIGNSTGQLTIYNHTDNGDINFQADDNSGGLLTYFFLDGSAKTLEYRVPLNIGVDDAGHDVRFYGATSGRYMEWDESSDRLEFTDNATLSLGSGADLLLYHNATNTYIENATGNLEIINSQDDGDIIFKSDDGSGGVAEYMSLDGSIGYVKFTKPALFLDSVVAGFGGNVDLKLVHDGTDSNITNTTGDLNIINHANDKDIIFQSDDGSGGNTAYLTIDGSETRTNVHKEMRFDDTTSLKIGSGGDLVINHNSGNNFIGNVNGNLDITQYADNKDIIFQNDDGSGGTTAYLTLDGSATNMKVAKDMRFADNVDAEFGDGGDFKIYHDGSNTYLEQVNAGTGNIVISNANDDGDIVFQSDDGSGGVEEYFRLDGSAGGGAPVTKFPDGARLQFGGGGDSTMTHDGSNFTISTVTGDFRIKCDTDDGDVKLQCDDGSGGVTDYLVLDGGDKTLIASVPLVLEADSAVGWHGSVTRVKILPRDFAGDTSGRPLMINAAVNGDRYLSSNASASMFASIPIPTGFKATHVKIHGSDTGNNFTVFEANIANKDVTTVGSATAIETEKAITNVDSSTTNYIMVEVGSNGTTDEIHGGYMTIAKI